MSRFAGVGMGTIAYSGSLAVEVCCGALQHPEGVAAPAAQHDTGASSATSHQDSLLPLGPVPHMLRHASGDLQRHVSTCQAWRLVALGATSATPSTKAGLRAGI